jgi:hypothetical protein
VEPLRKRRSAPGGGGCSEDRRAALILREMPWRAVVAVLVAATFYTELVIEFGTNEVWSWLHQLLATLIAVFFAFVVGLALYNYQTRTTAAK